MAREILRSDVRLGFNDAANRVTLGMSSHQILSQKLLGDVGRSLFVKRARKFQGQLRSSH